MSRITKWQFEKTKVKVVFRLQFHATHIPQTGWDKLFISFIPADSGKATAKTTKANVRNGTCKWADPIYETTRLLQDTKTKQYDGKLYKLVVAMGSSRSNVLGEAIINLAEFVDASKPSEVSLLLNGEAGTTLHVTVQLLTSKTGFREFEQQRELREKGLQSSSDQTSIVSSDKKEMSLGKKANNHVDKVNARAQFKRGSEELICLSSIEEEAGVNEEFADAALGIDGSSNTSESLYAEKHDMSSTHEVESLKSTMSGDLDGLSFNPSPKPEKGDSSDNQYLADSWVSGWSSECAAASDMAAVTVYEENNRLRSSVEEARSSLLELKSVVITLQSHADEVGGETQKFSQQLAAEISSSEELSKEVLTLKSECLKLKLGLQHVKNSKLSWATRAKEPVELDKDIVIQNLQLKWLEGLIAVEDKLTEVQKICLGNPERELRLVDSDLQNLVEVLQNLKERICELVGQIRTGTRPGAEGTFPSSHASDLIAYGSGSIDPTIPMKRQIFELLQELEQSKTEQRSLAKKMNQMECYYEALVQQLEQNQRHLMEELHNLRNEHSTCLYTLSSSKSEMEKIHHELNEQMIKFAEEKCNLDSLNKELERRAITAESALKRARLNYSIAVKQLQKDLELLSCQVVSMYETNEKLMKQAFSEPLLTSFDGRPESLKNQKMDSGKFLKADTVLCQNHNAGLKQQQLGTDILLMDLKQSLQSQEELYQTVQEVSEMHLVNCYLDVFSQALRETLLEADADITTLRENILQLSHQLELSSESKEILMLRLQGAMDDIRSLNEFKANCNAKNDDLTQNYQLLQSNFENLAEENLRLTQKIKELDALLVECECCKGEHEVCRTENIELTNLLEKEKEENEHLHSQISLLQNELMSVIVASDDVASVKDNLQNTIESLSDKLHHLLASFHHNFNVLSLWSEPVCLNIGSKDLGGLVLQLEELQLTAYDRVRLLVEENKHLMNAKNVCEASLCSAKSEIVILKTELEHNIKSMDSNLSLSSAQVQKLHSEFEAFVRRLKVRSDAEENFTQQQNNLLSDLDHLETELQKLAQRNDDFAQEALALNCSVSDLETCKLTIAELTEQNAAMMVSLQEKSKEDLNTASELNQLKKSLNSLNDKLHAERSLTEKLKSTIVDLTSELNEKDHQVQDLDQHRSDVLHLKQLVSDLELEKSTVSNLLMQSEQRLKFVTGQNEAMMVSLQEKSKEVLNTASELNQLKESLNSLNDELHAERSLTEKLKSTIANLTSELNEKDHRFQEFDQHRSDVLHLNDELHAERGLTEKLENKIADLTSELNEKDHQLQDCDQYRSNVLHLKQLVSDLELEKSTISSLLVQSEQRLKYVSGEHSLLEIQLSEIHEHAITTEISLTVTKSQYEDLSEQLCFRKGKLHVLNEKYLKVEAELRDSVAKEARLAEENKLLLTSLNSTRSELEELISLNTALIDKTSLIMAETEEYETVSHSKESQYGDEIGRLEQSLASTYSEIEELVVSKEELEIQVLFLHGKLDELLVSVNSLQQYDEVSTLQKQCSELSKRLSEQILKTEEYKNLSIHLKELKDKADSECLNAREKRGTEGQPAAMQESLRIAFIKEQYETKLQELKQQLSVSKKHGEEILWKFQDAIDEVENKRKSEASLIKRNEELGMKILELEAELQSAVSDKREIMKAYDCMKAEKECSSISLECCKEEKKELEASLIKCEEEKSKIAEELNVTKELIGRSRSQNSEILDAVSGSVNGNSGNTPYADTSETMNHGETKSASSVDREDHYKTTELLDIQPEKDDCQSAGDVSEIQYCRRPTKELQCNNLTHMALNNDLRSSMDLLNKELERMKNENLLHSADADNETYDLCFPGLQRELTRLHEANEELQNIFPVFKDISITGNAIERVLTLEIELAERLMAEKKSSLHFQSSFLKQHSDEEAIFQSFRDINELIKDMLELKARHVAVETELKEMHERYSQLSLQFAEVEGERQKLMMTLRNSRAPKKALLSSLSFMDHS